MIFELPKNTTVFQCQSGSFISLLLVCNGKQDCPAGDSDDEHGCQCHAPIVYPLLCKIVDFFINGTLDWQNTVTVFKKLLLSTVDQPNLSGLSSQEHTSIVHTNCERSGMLPCRAGNPMCYSVSQLCKFEMNPLGQFTSCQMGDHLDQCSKFQCNMMYKCPGYYCVPWHYVCDGKWDCPSGIDEHVMHACKCTLGKEQCGVQRTCKNLFKCTNSVVCIHVAWVCDGYANCPSGDDETLCAFNKIKCPHGCTCMLSGLMCENQGSKGLFLDQRLPYNLIFVHNCTEAFLKYLWKKLSSPVALFLPSNNLLRICEMKVNMETIMLLDFDENNISRVERNYFHQSRTVKIILIKRNKISTIDRFGIAHLKSLVWLDLSHNNLTTLGKCSVFCLPKLQILNIMCNQLTHILFDFFENLQLVVLMTEHSHLCCLVTEQKICTENICWYQSCSSLIKNRGFKIVFISMSVLVQTLNIVCLWLHTKGSTKVFDFFVFSTNVVECGTGLYLSILWICDVVHKDLFFLNVDWTSSSHCLGAFGLSLHNHLATPIMSSFMTLARLMVTKYPFDSKFKETAHVLKWITVTLTFTITVALGFTLLTWLLLGKIPASFCSPVFDPTHSVIISVLSSFIATLQLIVVVSVVVMYILVVCEVKRSQKTTGKRKSNASLLLQVIVLCSSVTLTWIPSGVIYICLTVLDKYPQEIMVVTTCVIVPINSIVVPLVFTFKILCSGLENSRTQKTTDPNQRILDVHLLHQENSSM